MSLIQDTYRIPLIVGGFTFGVTALVLLQPGQSAKDTRQVALPAPSQAASTLTEVTQLSAQVAPAAAQPVIVPKAETPAMLNMTNSVLAGLGVTTPDTSQDTSIAGASGGAANGDMRDLTSSVLAGLGQVSGTAASDAPATNLQGLIAQALNEGQTDAYITALLDEAFDRGLIEAPKALTTEDGGVDTATLVSQLARAASGAKPKRPEAQALVGGPGVEVRVVQEAGKTVQYNFYTVQQGDSLGAIAHKFYGDAAEFTRIYEANRRFLPSPDRIRVGQRLSIPALSDV
ncbi:LysM peptidoglycan-binding domain-containing protein [Aliiroseovarius marinus]|uniref:LysM peptidoglycan-binding domain-containing protein n=1 Tax=Aliiroseovarius marinus TaxID=2500159 RepID=UPI003D7D47DD